MLQCPLLPGAPGHCVGLSASSSHSTTGPLSPPRPSTTDKCLTHKQNIRSLKPLFRPPEVFLTRSSQLVKYEASCGEVRSHITSLVRYLAVKLDPGSDSQIWFIRSPIQGSKVRVGVVPPISPPRSHPRRPWAQSYLQTEDPVSWSRLLPSSAVSPCPS